jgi:Uma2 family endonuclease
MSPASTLHQDISDFLASILRFYVEERRLGRIITSRIIMRPARHLPGREPDIMFVSSENIGRIRENSIEGSADLVIEVISMESRTRDTIEKLREYEEGGVREYWIVDPYDRRVTFLQAGNGGKFLEVNAQDGIYHSKVIAGLWLATPWLWERPRLSTVFREWGLI